MQIHELVSFDGRLDSTAFLPVDDGTNTGKVSVPDLTGNIADEIERIDSRIDNIITSPAPTEQEIIDARFGANDYTYDSLGDAIRGQVDLLESNLTNISPEDTNFLTREHNSFLATTIAEIDPDYKEYSGVYVNPNTGNITSQANDNIIAFRVPFDGFTIKTALGAVALSDEYPDLDTMRVTVKETLPGTAGNLNTYTCPRKGDIAILTYDTRYDQIYLTNINNIITADHFYVKDDNDPFTRNVVTQAGVNTLGNSQLNITKISGQILNWNSGGLTANASYDTYYFKVPVESLTVKCTNGFRAMLVYKIPASNSSIYNKHTQIYQYASGRVETFTATYGLYVAISVAASEVNINIQTDLLKMFTMPALLSGENYLSSDAFYKYEESGSSKYLHIYFKSGEKFVKWELHNVPSQASNSDTWQIGHVCGLDGDLTNETEIVKGGEFELAFKENGAADYCGGNNHGDETTDSFVLHIDGAEIDTSQLDNDYHIFTRIDAFEIATVNRCNTPADDILKHLKVWTFENGKVTVHQTIEFLETLQVDGMLVCMLPALRASFGYGIRQGRVGIETMTSQGYTKISTISDEIFYMMYGDNATARVSSKTDNPTDSSAMWINDTSDLNKLYYGYYGVTDSAHPTTVQQGSIAEVESTYDIAYN